MGPARADAARRGRECEGTVAFYDSGASFSARRLEVASTLTIRIASSLETASELGIASERARIGTSAIPLPKPPPLRTRRGGGASAARGSPTPRASANESRQHRRRRRAAAAAAAARCRRRRRARSAPDPVSAAARG